MFLNSVQSCHEDCFSQHTKRHSVSHAYKWRSFIIDVVSNFNEAPFVACQPSLLPFLVLCCAQCTPLRPHTAVRENETIVARAVSGNDGQSKRCWRASEGQRERGRMGMGGRGEDKQTLNVWPTRAHRGLI